MESNWKHTSHTRLRWYYNQTIVFLWWRLCRDQSRHGCAETKRTRTNHCATDIAASVRHLAHETVHFTPSSRTSYLFVKIQESLGTIDVTKSCEWQHRAIDVHWMRSKCISGRFKQPERIRAADKYLMKWNIIEWKQRVMVTTLSRKLKSQLIYSYPRVRRNIVKWSQSANDRFWNIIQS